MHPKHIAYLRPYEKDGRTRIWIEGRRVADAGFAPGKQFAIRYAKGEIELTLTQAKGKKVHAKTRNGGAWPIIDIFNEQVGGALGTAARLRAEFSAGNIRIAIAGLSQTTLRRIEKMLGSASGQKALAAGSLFHGLGVLDHAIHEGLKDGGVAAELAFAVEKDPTGLDASLANNPLWQASSLAILGDLEDIDIALLPKIDILCAGIPCQGASPQGRTSLKLSAPEWHPGVGHLFIPYLKVVEATEPGILVIENVPSYQTSIGFEMIRRQLERLGYELETAELSGQEFGSLENRKRLVGVACAKGLPPVLENLTRTPAAVTLGSLLDSIAPDAPIWKDYAHVKRKLIRDAVKPRNGMKANMLTPAATLVPAIIKGYCETKSWQPFVAHATNPGLMRKFTAAEHCRIKGIPESLIAGLPETVAHGLLGQSVIHPVFRAVGRAIAAALRSAKPAARVPAFTLAA